MGLLLLHIILLAILALPIIVTWLSGPPQQHQATAAAWLVGLMFSAGLWVCQLVISSGLMIWLYKIKKLSLAGVIGLHLLSAFILVSVLYLWALLFG